MKQQQGGAFIVDFAVTAPVAFMILFACFEMGHALFVWNTAVEATRRGARIAAVVDPLTGATTIQNAVATFADQTGIQTTSVDVHYYKKDGTEETLLTSTGTMAFVTVSVKTGLTLALHIPFVNPTISLPTFSTTVPVESLGFNPDT